MPDTDIRARAFATVQRLLGATNAHDIDAIVACFAPGYRNETPAHPSRGFVGPEQVRRNWTGILAAVPDLRARIVASTTDAATVWTEWEHRGTRPDGTPHLMRGVIVFDVADELITSARFFLEPVDARGGGIDAAVREHLGSGSRS